ncbi:hypothetical protein SAMN02745673_01959 [Marinactinospora thermotolerans DSM 45154]|uniref:Uncharacterized protein n=1 Tax=Marinactinospora thermotolerans DSM 45154 TaxID=1122192 RepID=A0A1T4PRF3_9ACTN|nr:hypothetical protein SAMN02745673_01959 [Marinactinospora thermotolerans DSM 45154]
MTLHRLLPAEFPLWSLPAERSARTRWPAVSREGAVAFPERGLEAVRVLQPARRETRMAAYRTGVSPSSFGKRWIALPTSRGEDISSVSQRIVPAPRGIPIERLRERVGMRPAGAGSRFHSHDEYGTLAGRTEIRTRAVEPVTETLGLL